MEVRRHPNHSTFTLGAKLSDFKKISVFITIGAFVDVYTKTIIGFDCLHKIDESVVIVT